MGRRLREGLQRRRILPAALDAQTGPNRSRVTADPLMVIRCYWDIGGTGAKGGRNGNMGCSVRRHEIRVLNYYEAQGPPMAEHVHWLRGKGYMNELCKYVPHDGGQHEKN